jgi:hypothetical protein
MRPRGIVAAAKRDVPLQVRSVEDRRDPIGSGLVGRRAVFAAKLRDRGPRPDGDRRQSGEPAQLTADNLPQIGVMRLDKGHRPAKDKKAAPRKGDQRNKPKPSRIFEIDEDTPASKREERLAGLEERWAVFNAPRSRSGFVAYVDDVPASAGQLAYLSATCALLTGGATRPWARGRGCYRALVEARWDLVSPEGIRAFVVQASDMSMPILAGLGFRTTAALHVLVDRP